MWNHKFTAQKKKTQQWEGARNVAEIWSKEVNTYIQAIPKKKQLNNAGWGWHIFSMGRPTVLLETPMVQRHRPDRCIPRGITISGFDPIYRVGSMKTEERGRPNPGQSAISTSMDRWKRITTRRGYLKATFWWREDAMYPSTTLNEEIDVVRRWQQHGRMELRRLVPAAESLKPMMSRLIAWAWYRSHCQIWFNRLHLHLIWSSGTIVHRYGPFMFHASELKYRSTRV